MGRAEFHRDPDLILNGESEKEYYLNEGLARVIDGKIVIGKTEEEIEENEIKETVKKYREYLKNTDYVTKNLIKLQNMKEEYEAKRNEYKDILENREKWRRYISLHG